MCTDWRNLFSVFLSVFGFIVSLLTLTFYPIRHLVRPTVYICIYNSLLKLCVVKINTFIFLTN